MAKAEHLPKGKNPRFIVTSLTSEESEAQELYEKIYFAPEARWRTASRNASSISSQTALRRRALRANQLRLWFASLAYVLMTALRRMALQRTELAQATAGTIRLKLLKLGALGHRQRPPDEDRHCFRLPYEGRVRDCAPPIMSCRVNRRLQTRLLIDINCGQSSTRFSQPEQRPRPYHTPAQLSTPTGLEQRSPITLVRYAG